MKPFSSKSLLIFVLLVNMLGLAVAIMMGGQQPGAKYGEGGFITTLSVFNLILISGINFFIFFQKKAAVDFYTSVRKPLFLWFLMGLGFIFLAVYEKFKIHEDLDFFIHRVLGMKETFFSDSIDDLMILVYGIIGLSIILFYQSEITLLKPAWSLLFIGFILLFLMVIIDVISTRDEIISIIFQPGDTIALHLRLGLMEDFCKILSEMAFMGAFFICLKKVQAN